MASENRGSLRTWRASVRSQGRGGYRLGMIVAPNREAAEATAAELYNLSAEDRARLWLIDLSPQKVGNGSFYRSKKQARPEPPVAALTGLAAHSSLG